MTTKESVDEKILEVDGSASSADVALKKRWRTYHQTAADLMWNDRMWQFKKADGVPVSIDANPDAKAWLPTSFGSFEGLVGAGIFPAIGQPSIEFCYSSEMVELKKRSTQQVGTPRVCCLGYDSDESLYFIEVFPRYAVTTQVTAVFLKRSPKLQYVETSPPPTVDSGTDEMSWFPEQWHRLIGYGAEWLQKVKTGNALATTEHEIWKAGFEQMRARERCIIASLEPYRPGRRRR